MKKIIIIGNYGDGNIGDEAILDVLVDEIVITNTQPVDIVVPSRNPGKLEELHKKRIRAISPERIIKEFISTDTIILGGGTVFSRYSGIYIYFSLFLIILSKMSGKHAFFRGIGISGNLPFILEIMIKFAIRFVEEISTRDIESFAIFKQMGFRKKMSIVTDYGSRMSPANQERIENILLKENINRNELLIGLSLNYHREEKINNEMIRIIPETIDWIINNYNVQIIFFTFCPSFSCNGKKSDTDLGKRLFEQMQNKNKFKVLDYYIHNETLGLIGEMDIFVGMRYHSQVFAHKQDIPLVGVIYDDKCRRFLNENHLEGMDISDVIAYPGKFRTLISNRIEKIRYSKYERYS